MKTLSKKQVNEIVEVTPNEVWMEVLSEVDNSCTLFFNYNNEWYTTSRKLENVYQVPLNTLKVLVHRKHSDFAQDGVIAETPNNLLEQVTGCNLLIKPTTDKVNLFTPKAVARILLLLSENEAGDKLKTYIFKNFENYKMEELKKEKRKETNKKNKPSTVGVRFKTHEQKTALENFAKDNNLTLSSALVKFALQYLTDNGYLQDKLSEMNEDEIIDIDSTDVLDNNLSDKEREMIKNISDSNKVSLAEAYKIYKNTLTAN